MGVRNILFLLMYGCCMGVCMGEAFFNGILTKGRCPEFPRTTVLNFVQTAVKAGVTAV